MRKHLILKVSLLYIIFSIDQHTILNILNLKIVRNLCSFSNNFDNITLQKQNK